MIVITSTLSYEIRNKVKLLLSGGFVHPLLSISPHQSGMFVLNSCICRLLQAPHSQLLRYYAIIYGKEKKPQKSPPQFVRWGFFTYEQLLAIPDTYSFYIMLVPSIAQFLSCTFLRKMSRTGTNAILLIYIADIKTAYSSCLLIAS